MATKLKALKAYMKVWNNEVFGNVSIRKGITLNQVGFWDSKEREGPLSQEETKARRLASKEFRKWVMFKEASWRQKYREI